MDVRKDYVQALAIAKKGAKEFPRDVDFQYLLSKLYMLNKDLPNAQRKIDEIITKAPDYKDAYMLAANIQLARNNENGALLYINKGIGRFGKDRDLRMKKLNIYQAAGNYNLADAQADSLLYYFGNDKTTVNTYINYRNEAGTYFFKAGNMTRASMEFEKVLEVDPRNKQALDARINTKLQSGDRESSLAMINMALIKEPNSYELLLKKAGILQELKTFPRSHRSPAGGS